MSPRLELVTPANVRAACDLTVLPEQEAVVAPVVVSLAEAYASRDTAWPRLVYDEDQLVGFIMAAFDPGNQIAAFRHGIWRLNIAAGHQGKGYGRFAVDAVIAEAQCRGADRISVLWVPHEHGPAEFYLRMGFQPTGESIGGQIVAERRL
ncbi:GNAT family N-acetyltransferase [Kibdelosporangium phytohabitans]|uniref:Acetyltransferase n=1 Tax=Kibdelosporangium phytohabitans TaxID=860235 RepID=A0A0N9HZX9_9PSEU|nr:GNAT family N-acetyltransferase [Kibdelosporangium phytohabitans]ALG09112.1 acetyltransferase [Kibdelosporangium phytohabitans]MBE1469687.1 diamine N-acetyltransferase [Kibdelosporangium phytohabitans]